MQVELKILIENLRRVVISRRGQKTTSLLVLIVFLLVNEIVIPRFYLRLSSHVSIFCYRLGYVYYTCDENLLSSFIPELSRICVKQARKKIVSFNQMTENITKKELNSRYNTWL